MLSGPPPASPYASATPLDITDALSELVVPLLSGPGGLDAAIDNLLGGLMVAILNHDQRGRRTWHAPRPDRTPDGRKLALLPCWSGRAAWVTACIVLLASDAGREVLRRNEVAAARVIEYARACASFAESTTGRHMTAALSTIAERADLSFDQARRSRRVLNALELHVQVSAGRHLTGLEIMAARVHHGGRQRAIASEYSLTMPAHVVAAAAAEHAPVCDDTAAVIEPSQNVIDDEMGPSDVSAPLSPFGDRSISSLDMRSSLKSTRSINRAQTSTRRRSHRRVDPRPLALQRLAGRLVGQMQGMDAAGMHLGRICDVLSACGIDPERWSPTYVRAALDHDGRTAGLSWPDTMTDPPAYLAWRLRRIDWTQPTPAELHQDIDRPRVVIDDFAPTPRPPEASPETRAAARAALAAHLSRPRKLHHPTPSPRKRI